jgi:hypothetical protein
MLALAGQIKTQAVVFQTTRDLKHLSAWQRGLWYVWFQFSLLCYWLGLPTLVAKDGARLELQAVCTSDAVAQSIMFALGDGAFWKTGPVDMSLPRSNVVFGGDHYPLSEASKMYERRGRREVAILCPISETPCTQHESITRRDLLVVHDKLKTLATS